MTVEAVESKSSNLNNNKMSKRDEHMLLLQLYGRFSIILGSLLVGLLNIYMFSDIKNVGKDRNIRAYSRYLFYSLIYSSAYL